MTFEEARTFIYTVFTAVWGETGPVIWQDVGGNPPRKAIPYACPSIHHGKGGQRTLVGDVGQRRFERTGIIRIQIFAPLGDGMVRAYQLAQLVSNAYEDARSDVWFRNTRIREMGASGAFEQVDVLTDFSYDEVR